MATYRIEVKTNAVYGRDMTDDVRIILHGRGKCTNNVRLDKSSDVVSFKANRDIPEVKKIEIWRENTGSADGLYLENINVTNEGTGITSQFHIMRLIKPKEHYFFNSVSTCLPQNDPNKLKRAAEIQQRQSIYEMTVRGPGGPAAMKNVQLLPSKELVPFSDLYELGVLDAKIRAVTIKRLTENGPRCESLEDINSTYDGDLFREPKGAYVNDDAKFGRQRLTGVNRDMIELCTEIPEKFGVTEEMISPFLEGKTLKQAIDTNRMFLADFVMLEGTPTKTPELVVPAPIGLFYFTDANQLMPVAIQLNQQKGPENPVFLPSDPECTWMIAKMWFNMADAHIHQAHSHFTCTHLVMEGIVVSLERQLSPTHPIYKLLKPHTYLLLPKNAFDFNNLTVAGGFDQVSNGGAACFFFLMKKRLLDWRLDVDGTLPEYLKKKKIYDQSVLTGAFHYRDDGMLTYNAIKTYVTKYVKHYYASEGSLAADHEIQAFGAEIAESKEDGGAGILGVPNGGKFDTVEQLIDTLTPVICTLSIGHAAANFPEYDEYASPLNYPYIMNGLPPKTKDPLTMKDVLNSICNRLEFHTLLAMALILSDKTTQSLGHFEKQYLDDPPALKILEEFNEELREIQKSVEERNKQRKFPYEFLEPQNIPNGASV